MSELERAIAQGSGHLDADTYYSPDTHDAAWHAAGGAIELATALVDGRARRGFARCCGRRGTTPRPIARWASVS
ncbi:MAG: hypothetical protein M5U28_38240 [Sandaracinaceae bacterium]|nr:hypothetical protein [Sandaracinaceae bacterium]